MAPNQTIVHGVPLVKPPSYSVFQAELGGKVFGKGYLTVVHNTSSLSVEVRSGLAAYQSPKHFWTRGKGPIPPSKEVRVPYKVSMKPYFSKKVQGMFYHILPDPIQHITDDDKVRSEVGIHFDSGVVGTSCCEGVVSVADFVHLEDFFKKILYSGIHELPHYVIY